MKAFFSLLTIASLANATLLPTQKNEALSATENELFDILIRYGNNADGIPPLHYAIKMKDEGAVQELLDHGADANSRIYGPVSRDIIHTALDFAVVSGNINIINLLIEKGARIVSNNPNDPRYFCSPIWFAVVNDLPDVVECLIYHGAIGGKFHDIQQLKHLIGAATSSGSVNILKWFKNAGVDFTQYYPNNHNLLVGSIKHPEILNFLLEQKINANPTTPQGGSFALCEAALYKYLESVEILISYSADVCLLDSSGNSPLWAAIADPPLARLPKDVYHIVRALIDAGANVNQKNPNGIPLIMHAACQLNRSYSESANCYNELYEEYKMTIEYMLSKGADINQTDAHGKTSLFNVKNNWGNKKGVVNWLIAHGAKD